MLWVRPPNLNNRAAANRPVHVAEMTQKPEHNFYSIIDQHHDRIKKFILVTVKDEWIADDLTQETFFRAHKNMDTLKDHAKISSWLFRIAYNLCLDHFRSAARQPLKAFVTEEDKILSNLPSTQKQLEQQQMGECIQSQIRLLPETDRTVVWLFDVLGFTLKETAEVLDISLENVKVRLHRARKKLKSILEKNCVFERDERDVLVCLPLEETHLGVAGKEAEHQIIPNKA